MKVCVAGKNKIAIDTVKFLLDYGVSHDDIIVIFNRNEDGINSWQPSFKFFCQKEGIEEMNLKYCYNIKDIIFLSTEFDRIIRPSRFNSSQLFNIHFSLLPAYKGMYTSVLPLLNGEHSTGVTLHKIDAGIDTGDIIDQIEFILPESINARKLYDLFLENGKNLIEKKLPLILDGNYGTYPQPQVNSTYYSRTAIDFSKIDIDLNATAWHIHNQIRAFSFRPFQLPVVYDSQITHSFILDSKSLNAPGVILEDEEDYMVLSSIDYDIMLYKDRLEYVLYLAETGQLERLEKLQKLGIDILEKNNKGWDALIVATYNEQLEMCRWLLIQGADINTCNYNGTNLLMYAMSAAAKSGNRQIMSFLIESGVNLHQRDFNRKSLWEYAQETNSEVVVDFLRPYTD